MVNIDRVRRRVKIVKSRHLIMVSLWREIGLSFSKVSGLLEELLETVTILEDEDTMVAIREAEEDMKAGRVRDYDEFIKELKDSGEI